MYRRRRLFAVVVTVIAVLSGISYEAVQGPAPSQPSTLGANTVSQVRTLPELSATEVLTSLDVKGRAPKTGYQRDKFSSGWGEVGGCSTRELILKRDLTNVALNSDGCRIMSGTLQDPYTGKQISFIRGQATSQAVQIDHIVAVSDAWQKGARQLTPQLRYQFYNDPLNLLAVDGPTNNKKGDGDAATWLPPNKDYRCRYVARQVAVKYKYSLWVTDAEKSALATNLSACPGQLLPKVSI